MARAMGEIIFAEDLARQLGISEAEVYEIARLRPVPYIVSSASPKRLAIDAAHLSIWKAAVDAEPQ